jgi:hypothetical protein
MSYVDEIVRSFYEELREEQKLMGHFIETDEMTTYFIYHDLNQTRVLINVNTMKELECFRVVFELPTIVPIEKRVELADFFFKKNEYLSLGSYVLSFESGKMIFKSDLDYEHYSADVSNELFNELMSDCMDELNFTFPEIMHIIYSSVNPKFTFKQFNTRNAAYFN